jgi:hypothetical protein
VDKGIKERNRVNEGGAKERNEHRNKKRKRGRNKVKNSERKKPKIFLV